MLLKTTIATAVLFLLSGCATDGQLPVIDLGVTPGGKPTISVRDKDTGAAVSVSSRQRIKLRFPRRLPDHEREHNRNQ